MNILTGGSVSEPSIVDGIRDISDNKIVYFTGFINDC